MEKLRIGIVGGSITGCTAAIAASRAGMDVRVFERSTVPLSDRGAGLGVPTATCITLRDQGYIDDSLPHLSVRSLAHSSRPRAGSGHDGIAGQVPTWLEAIRWGHLYERLRSRVPSERYVQGREVITATQSTERVVLTFDDGNHEQFDVVVFADGYRSIGRALVSPNRQPQYQGYFLWRGMVPETQIDVERFDQTLQRVGYPGGHLFAYLLPGADGSTAVGHRELNWGMFLSRSSDALGELLVDKHGGQQDLSVPPGHLRDDIEHHLKAQAKTLLPERFARLVQASEATFGQGIVATQPDRYHLGRLCLAGDAGAVVPPFTTSGVFKGMTNAIELVASLQAADTLMPALDAWDLAQQQAGVGLKELSDLMEDRLITNVPDFSELSLRELDAWWSDIQGTLEQVMS